MPMRVLQVITRLNVGGPARHAIQLGQGLHARGFESMLVHGVIDDTEGSLEDLLVGSDIAATKLPDLGRPVRPWHDLRALLQLNRIIFREHPDIVHTHTAKAGMLGRLAACVYNMTRRRADRCAVIHTFHGHVFSGYFGPMGSHAVRLVERGLALLTDRIVTVSHRQQRDISERYRIAPQNRVDVLELGTDLRLLRLSTNTSLRVALEFQPHHVVFGYAGRFVPIKNLSMLIRAFAVVAQRSDDARLMLVGDGELRGEIETLVEELGLGGRVRFAGWQHDVTAIYGALDVAVLASNNEGTPLMLIEAMAAGRPVIATAVGGVADIVREGQNRPARPARRCSHARTGHDPARARSRGASRVR
jgi:glycosyltransferase involved in cell wall biosynthesis